MAAGDMDEVIGRFPARLKELRERASLTQTELSARSGVPQATIAAYELGRHAPPWGAVVRLADALGVSADSFRVAPAPPKQDST